VSVAGVAGEQHHHHAAQRRDEHAAADDPTAAEPCGQGRSTGSDGEHGECEGHDPHGGTERRVAEHELQELGKPEEHAEHHGE
jgi:hypothetical protein